MELILNARQTKKWQKGSTKYYVKAFIRESEVIEHNLPYEWADTEQNLSIFEWPEITGVNSGTIRNRILSAEKDKEQLNTPRQVVGLDPLTVRKSQHVPAKKNPAAVKRVASSWLCGKAI